MPDAACLGRAPCLCNVTKRVWRADGQAAKVNNVAVEPAYTAMQGQYLEFISHRRPMVQRLRRACEPLRAAKTLSAAMGTAIEYALAQIPGLEVTSSLPGEVNVYVESTH